MKILRFGLAVTMALSFTFSVSAATRDSETGWVKFSFAEGQWIPGATPHVSEDMGSCAKVLELFASQVIEENFQGEPRSDAITAIRIVGRNESGLAMAYEFRSPQRHQIMSCAPEVSPATGARVLVFDHAP